MKTIVITGGNGNLAKEIIKQGIGYKILAPDRNTLNITIQDSIDEYLNNHKVDYLIHSAALTKPMSIHEYDITESISTNIIGTANVVKCCKKYGIKMIHISTDYVYPANASDVKEDDGLLPFNNYGWSKLGAEASVQMYKNSLILRLSFLPKPFPFPKAFTNIMRNVNYIDDVVKNIFSVLDEFGVMNIGSDNTKNMYELALETNSEVEPMEDDIQSAKEKSITLNIDKLKKVKRL
jgi:dTDP-4-dehydrorhamnose reductase